MPDVHVLVAAYRTDTPHHGVARNWLEEAVSGIAPVGLGDAVLTGFVRVVTHPRVFVEPTPVAEAALAIEAGATWITFDRDFARFPGLSWQVPQT